MRETRPISTPLKRRWQLFRARALPVVIWLVASGLVVTLWSGRATRVDAIGVIEANQMLVAPAQAGTVVSLGVDVLDEVRVDQPVAMLDDTALRASVAVAEAETRRLEAALRAMGQELTAEAGDRERRAFDDSRTYAFRIEQLKLDKLNREIDIVNDEGELKRLGATLDRNRGLLEQGLVDQQTFDDIHFQHQRLVDRIQKSKDALAVAERDLMEATNRQGGPQPATGSDRIEVALAPLQAEINVQLKRVDEIMIQRQGLILKSKWDGVVSAVYRRPGETVLPGDPVVAIADRRSTRIRSYVEEGTLAVPQKGMVVTVRRRTYPVQVAQSTVLKVGPQVEPLPPRFLRNPAYPRWGVHVLIGMPDSLMLAADSGTASPACLPPRPGEVLDLTYVAARR